VAPPRLGGELDQVVDVAGVVLEPLVVVVLELVDVSPMSPVCGVTDVAGP